MAITKNEIREFLKSCKNQALNNLKAEYEPLINSAAEEITSKFQDNINRIEVLASSLYTEIDTLYKKMAQDTNVGCNDYHTNGLWDAESLANTKWKYSIVNAMTVNNKYKQLKYEYSEKDKDIKNEYGKLDRMITKTNSIKQILTSLEALGFDATKIESNNRQNALLVVNADKDKLFYPNK